MFGKKKETEITNFLIKGQMITGKNFMNGLIPWNDCLGTIKYVIKENTEYLIGVEFQNSLPSFGHDGNGRFHGKKDSCRFFFLQNGILKEGDSIKWNINFSINMPLLKYMNKENIQEVKNIINEIMKVNIK